MDKPDILKSAAIIIRDHKILMTREHGEPFLAPAGGSVKNGEDPLVCLHRELEEELGVTRFTVNPSPLFTTPLAPAASQPDKMLQMQCYVVELLEEPRTTYNPDNSVDGEDIEELYWVGREDLTFDMADDYPVRVHYRKNPAGVRLTHMNEEHVFPKLIELGLI